MNTTIMIKPSSAYFVFIPAGKNTQAKWINLAMVKVIHLVTTDPLGIEIFDDEGESLSLGNERAEAVVKALTEFPHGKIIS